MEVKKMGEESGMTKRQILKRLKLIGREEYKIGYLHRIEDKEALLSSKSRESLHSILDDLYKEVWPTIGQAKRIMDKAIKRNDKKLIEKVGDVYASDFYQTEAYDRDLDTYHFQDAEYCYKLAGADEKIKKLADHAFEVNKYDWALSIYKSIDDKKSIEEKADSLLDSAKVYADIALGNPDGELYGTKYLYYSNTSGTAKRSLKKAHQYYKALDDKEKFKEFKESSIEIGHKAMRVARKYKDKDPAYLEKIYFEHGKNAYDFAQTFYFEYADEEHKYKDLIKKAGQEKEEFHKKYTDYARR
jgi:hypothetical protein